MAFVNSLHVTARHHSTRFSVRVKRSSSYLNIYNSFWNKIFAGISGYGTKTRYTQYFYNQIILQGWCVGHTCFVLCVFLCSALRFFEVANTKTVSFGSFWTLIRISAIREQTSLVLQKKTWYWTLKNWKHMKTRSFEEYFCCFLSFKKPKNDLFQ